MPRDVGIGDIEPDAVPGPVFVDGGFQECETASDALPAGSCQRCGSGGRRRGSLAFEHGGTSGRRGVVERLAKKLERCRADPRLLSFGLAEFAARRKHQMRRAVGFLVHVNLVVFGQRHAEFPFHRFPGVRQQAFAKVIVFAGFRHEAIRRFNGFLHRRPPKFPSRNTVGLDRVGQIISAVAASAGGPSRAPRVLDYQSLSVASRAPSAIASNLAQITVGWTSVW